MKQKHQRLIYERIIFAHNFYAGHQTVQNFAKQGNFWGKDHQRRDLK